MSILLVLLSGIKLSVMWLTLLLIVTHTRGQKIINCRSQNTIQQSKTTRLRMWHKFIVSVLLFCINHFNGNLQEATDSFWSEKRCCLSVLYNGLIHGIRRHVHIRECPGCFFAVCSTGEICHMPAVQKTDIPPKTFWRLALTVR